MREKYKSASYMAGFRSPQVQIQITPFMWGIQWGYSTYRIGLCLGPLAVVLWFRGSKFEVESVKD